MSAEQQGTPTPRTDANLRGWSYFDVPAPFAEFTRQLERELSSARAEVERLRENKDGAYLERNHLVAALARLYPSGLRRTDIPGWNPEWHGCCMIDLPTGQISYHYHDSQAHLFAGLPPYQGEWDGHDKETVHARLAALAATRKENEHG